MMDGTLSVLNPAGRDPAQSFPDGAGSTGKEAHPPVNYHGYAACHSGSHVRDVKELPPSTKVVIVLLRKRNLKAARKAILVLQSRKILSLISLKESGAHQVADFLNEAGRSILFREICCAADGFLSSTPELVPLYRSTGCLKGFFAPTPYPIGDETWNFGVPLEERSGIFVGTREFGVPSRNHWRLRRLWAMSFGCPSRSLTRKGVMVAASWPLSGRTRRGSGFLKVPVLTGIICKWWPVIAWFCSLMPVMCPDRLPATRCSAGCPASEGTVPWTVLPLERCQRMSWGHHVLSLPTMLSGGRVRRTPSGMPVQISGFRQSRP